MRWRLAECLHFTLQSTEATDPRDQVWYCTVNLRLSSLSIIIVVKTFKFLCQILTLFHFIRIVVLFGAKSTI